MASTSRKAKGAVRSSEQHYKALSYMSKPGDKEHITPYELLLTA